MDLFTWMTCFSLLLTVNYISANGNWELWWTYDDIAGDKFWGIMNPDWHMCSTGKRQSPINVDPSRIVYDPYLRRIHIEKDRISGILHNTGQSLLFRVDSEALKHVHISGGPLVYRYRFEELYIHFGSDNSSGSEHLINGDAFPAEIQLYGYNSQLYSNMTLAKMGPSGIVAISIMVMISPKGNDEIRLLSTGFNRVRYRGDMAIIHHLSLSELLPMTHHYMTYEGSTTYPGCWETTTWIIMNKPIYITNQELDDLRSLYKGEENEPKSKMADNFRPVKRLHHRTIRTNIDFTNAGRAGCPSMQRETFYAARQWPNYS